jgi:outer membrane receptor protein involved in Fe transport
MHYETVEDYYVFANSLTLFAATSASSDTTAWVPGVTDNSECLRASAFSANSGHGYQYNDPNKGAGQPTSVCYAIDPSPLELVDDAGHNYFLSRNPYTLNSYALFGETYYNILNDVKLTGGLRWTSDHKRFVDIPSELLAQGYGYAAVGDVNQSWSKFTGRAAINWTPKLDFTDQTLVYGSYAHGYKAGGANPPGAVLSGYSVGTIGIPVHPLTFAPEYIDAFELGTKNTALDGALTLNGDVFFYNYKGYQISEIVDRTSINLNFDATVKGAEFEATYEPLPGLRFKFAGGYEDTKLAKGSQSVDLMDRTAGHPGWVVFKPFVTLPSNCVFPDYVAAALITGGAQGSQGNASVSACATAYTAHEDPLTGATYSVPGYPGFDPVNPDATNNGYGPAPNDGAGFAKDLSGNELPNAPPFTVSFSADYTIPVTSDWAATIRGDYYWQDYSWARVSTTIRMIACGVTPM